MHALPTRFLPAALLLALAAGQAHAGINTDPLDYVPAPAGATSAGSDLLPEQPFFQPVRRWPSGGAEQHPGRRWHCPVCAPSSDTYNEMLPGNDMRFYRES